MSDSASSDAASPSRPSRPSMQGVAAVSAKQVVRGRRLFHELQTAVTATSERVGAEGAKMWAKSGEAWASVDSKLGLGAAVAGAAAAAEQRLQLREKVAAADRRFHLSEKAQEISQDWRTFKDKADVQQSQLLTRLNKTLVKAATKMVTARNFASALDPQALCYYDAADFPDVRGLVALTVDDVPCRQRDPSAAMLGEVKDLLAEFEATATFFLCTDDVPGHEEGLAALLRAGNEVANHGCEDKPYGGLSQAQFRDVFLRAESVCAEIRSRSRADQAPGISPPEEEAEASMEPHREAEPASSSTQGYPDASPSPAANGTSEALCQDEPQQIPAENKWFRAPHADMSSAMRRVLAEQGFTHVLCDSFANDTQIDDAAFISSSLLSMVDPSGGSIIVIHMPERGFREHNFEAMRLLLDGLRQRNLRAVTLSELSRAARQKPPNTSEEADEGKAESAASSIHKLEGGDFL